MGFLNLKKKTAYKFIKNQANKAKTAPENKTKSIERVGVIAGAGLYLAYDFTKGLSQKLGLDQSDIHLCLYNENDRSSDLIEGCQVNEKDFGLYGKIKSRELNLFLNRKMDLLINYCDPESVFPQVITARSKASYKAGFDHEHGLFYDIAIKIEGNKIDTFNTELVKYLKILKLIN